MILLDTNALIWLDQGHARTRALNRRAGRLYVSPASLLELQFLMEAGRIRLRPILMTALAMIIGMIPMALGLGDAGEQNAPLGRAVIGGLIMATLATLFIVPIGYTLLRRRPPALHSLDARFAAEAAGSGAGGVRQHD